MAATLERRSDRAIIGGAIVVSAFFVSFGVLHYGPFTKNLLLDTPLYQRYGDAVVHGGKIPYRDFGLEYPPAALLVFAAPALIAPAGDFALYSRVFEVLMLACGAVASALVAFVLIKQHAEPARLVAGTVLAGLAPLMLGPVVLSRFDLWPALLTVAALAALIADHRSTAFAALALGVAAKVYPVVLLPLALAYVWRREGRRQALAGAGVFAAVLAGAVLPFVVLSPGGVWAAFSDQASRPLQIESLGASFLLAAHQLWGITLNQVNSHGSDNLVGSWAGRFADLQSVLVVVVLVGLWVAFARGEATRDRLLRYSAATVCAFVALGKVLSPQYLIWLFALVPLVRGRRGLAAGVLFVAALVLTQLWFPHNYINLVYGLNAQASWFVLARDVTLVALLVTLVWPREHAPRAGVAVVASLAAAAAAATALAATAVPSEVTRHSGLLTESGLPSTCAGRKAVPGLSSGTVAYDVAPLSSPVGGGSCVTVAVTTQPRVELFSAAYRRAFVPANPQLNYLGDAGMCTNVAGLSGSRLVYSLLVRPGSRFAVEVENCGSGTAIPPYLIDVHDGRSGPVAYRAATAVRRNGAITVSWHTSAEAPGTTFAVYRDQNGVAIAVSGAPIRSAGARGGSYAVSYPGALAINPLRYFILARAKGRWSWYGPVEAGG